MTRMDEVLRDFDESVWTCEIEYHANIVGRERTAGLMTAPTVNTSSSDATLIAAVRAGNSAAYGILYERHSAAARSVARKLVRAAPDTDDVVAETFARVLSAIKNGAGPVEAFRPYLLTSVRRVAFDHLRGQRSQVPTDEADIPDQGEPFVDLAAESLERSLVARAFRSLPERWSAVLWHTEVEQASAAEVATLLGLTPNGVAALSYRAREGLRQAYLQFHLSAGARAECQPIAAKLGAHVRGGLSKRDARAVDDHLSSCSDCRAARAELAAINVTLRGVLAPVFLGGAMAGARAGAAAAHTGAAAGAGSHGAAGVGAATHGGAGVGGHLGSAVRRLGTALRHHPVAQIAAGLTATALLIPGSTVLTTRLPGHAGAQARQAIVQPNVSQVTPRPSVAHGRGSASAGTPRLSPGHSPSPSPAGRPSSGPSPSPSASQPRLTAKLSVAVSVLGLLKLGITTVVDVQVSDVGQAPTKALTVTLELPPGISLVSAGSAGWTCGQGSAGSPSCSGGPLGPGAASTVSFHVLVVNLNACGDAIIATAVSGSLTASGQSPASC
jgi:RNA polymerase sigma factor (sigma-70 family)